MTVPSSTVIVALAHAEAQAHPPRSPERRAAAWLWVLLTGTRTIRGTRLAFAAIPDVAARADAERLLGRLAELATTPSTPRRPNEMTMTMTDDDAAELARWTVGHRSAMSWLASDPPEAKVRAMLVKVLDRRGPATVFARIMAERLGVDPARLYAENWPRKAARFAAEARQRGDDPHADRLHAALAALMFCANCGRPLGDPVSVERGIGPDCWERIDPLWRRGIAERISSASQQPPLDIPEAS